MDVPLTGKGIKEALLCAAELEEIDLDLAFTSKLIRAQETLFLILSKQKNRITSYNVCYTKLLRTTDFLLG